MATLIFERSLWDKGFDKIIGFDEAGRGAWAGPVTVGALMVTPKDDNFHLIDGINDSKKLSEKRRETYFQRLVDPDNMFIYGIGNASHEEIDDLGINGAVDLAAQKAMDQIQIRADYILADKGCISSVFAYRQIPYMELIKGDGKSIAIAAASVLAKVSRDKMMVELSSDYPVYGFNKNKGYGGAESHRNALKQYGPCKIHRTSFKPIKAALKAAEPD